ncbi:MAG: hypothetical protein IKL24_02275 [Clostridia bacterium]|nr:hypothetical protein [Clostridia bacterium]
MATAKEKLTALADAVREKTGEGGKLSLDRMTALIKALSVGEGDLPDGWDTGSFTFSEDTLGDENENGIFIDHKLGKIPNFVFIWLNDPLAMGRNQWRAIVKYNLGEDVDEETGEVTPSYFDVVGMRMSNATHTATRVSPDWLDRTDAFYLPYYTSTYYKAGYTYNWLAVRFEE